MLSNANWRTSCRRWMDWRRRCKRLPQCWNARTRSSCRSRFGNACKTRAGVSGCNSVFWNYEIICGSAKRGFMKRVDWFDEKTHVPVIDEQVQKLSTFVDAMADGVIDRAELEKQQSSVIAAMRAVEAELNDDQHAKITRLLVELSAYNIMRLLHELQLSRREQAFNPARATS